MGEKVRAGSAWACILAGIVVLAGWAFDVPALKSVLPGLSTMKVNTAAAILMIGAALAGLPQGSALPSAPRYSANWRTTPTLWLSGAILALAGLTLAEYAIGASFGIDTLLASDPASTSLPFPGRMAPATAMGLAFGAVATILLALSTRGPALRSVPLIMAAHAAAVVPAGIGYLSVTGYLYDVAGLHSFGPFATMALHTSVLFLLLSLAILLTYPNLGWRRGFASRPVARRVFMRLLPAAVMLPATAGAIVVWGARAHLYDPLYAPALLALAAAGTTLWLAWYAAGTVRNAETRLNETTEALRESEARLRAITDAMPQMVWSARPDGVHDYYNQRWYALTGTTPFEDTGEGRAAVIHPDDRGPAGTRWDRSLETGEAFEMEYRLRMADGGYRWFLARALPLRDAGGAITRWFGTCTDIEGTVAARDAQTRSRTDLEHLVGERTRDLQETQTRLAHVQRMEALGQLAGGIAHDFNNVLQAVQSGAALLDRRVNDPEGVRRLSRMIFEAAGRGNAITRRLLAFSRRGDLQAEAISPGHLLSDIRDLLSHTLGARVDVRIVAPASLPSMLADRGQLETVLINLATNARDAMAGGGLLTFVAAAETVTVDMAGSYPILLTPGPFIRLSVSDTGSGMDTATLARACEPFFTTKPAGEGTGLGLAMARGFAEQSGGGLHVESAPARGTTVTLWFPVTTQPGNAPPIDPLGALAPSTPTALARLLLVDDEAMVRDILSEEMEAAGYAVLTAASGEAALALLEAGEPVDLLITDLSMPAMDGLALINAVHALQPGLPAVLLTGYATNAAEIAVNGALSGTLSLLRKPIKGKVLAERVAFLLTATARDPVE